MLDFFEDLIIIFVVGCLLLSVLVVGFLIAWDVLSWLGLVK